MGVAPGWRLPTLPAAGCLIVRASVAALRPIGPGQPGWRRAGREWRTLSQCHCDKWGGAGPSRAEPSPAVRSGRRAPCTVSDCLQAHALVSLSRQMKGREGPAGVRKLGPAGGAPSLTAAAATSPAD